MRTTNEGRPVRTTNVHVKDSTGTPYRTVSIDIDEHSGSHRDEVYLRSSTVTPKGIRYGREKTVQGQLWRKHAKLVCRMLAEETVWEAGP